jgi:ceramide kinase
LCVSLAADIQGHAEAAVKALTLEQLQALDGLVAVGGDGLFSELLTAVLTHSHLGAALQLRLGHIPAGSTDAVACT